MKCTNMKHVNPYTSFFFLLCMFIMRFLTLSFCTTTLLCVIKISFYNQYLNPINCSPQPLLKVKRPVSLLFKPTECVLS